MSDRVFVVYYRSIKQHDGEAKPTLDQQRVEFERRRTMHSSRILAEEFVEYEFGKDGDSGSRPKLRKAIDACKKHEDALLVLPRSKRVYNYSEPILDPIVEAEQDFAFIRGPMPADPPFQKQSSWSGAASSVIAGQYNSVSSDFSTIWPEIETNCSDILGVLRQCGTKLLYRGLGEDRGDAFISRPLDPKPSRDTPSHQHERLVEWMKREKFEAHRGNSVYATPNPTVATNYTVWKGGASNSSTVYAIFPCNGFKFSWSRAHPDFAVRIEPEFNALEVEDAIWSADIVSEGVLDALNHEHEMMFAKVPYYALRFSKYRSQIVGELGLSLHNEKAPDSGRTWDLNHG